MNKNTNTLEIFTAIALGTLMTAINVLPADAQTNAEELNYLEDIEAGKDGEWSFSTTSESLSVKDDLENLEEYSISESDLADVKLEEESRRRNSRRGIKDYSVEAEVYNY